MKPGFILAGEQLIRVDTIRSVDFSRVEDLKLVVYHAGGIARVDDIQAIELLMLLKPSALENRRLRWKRHAWAIHNLVGHPVMQLCAFFKLYRLAMAVHDATVPKPSGRK